VGPVKDHEASTEKEISSPGERIEKGSVQLCDVVKSCAPQNSPAGMEWDVMIVFPLMEADMLSSSETATASLISTSCQLQISSCRRGAVLTAGKKAEITRPIGTHMHTRSRNFFKVFSLVVRTDRCWDFSHILA